MTYASAAPQAGWSQLAINFNDHLDNTNVRRATAALRQGGREEDAIAQEGRSATRKRRGEAHHRKRRLGVCAWHAWGYTGQRPWWWGVSGCVVTALLWGLNTRQPILGEPPAVPPQPGCDGGSLFNGYKMDDYCCISGVIKITEIDPATSESFGIAGNVHETSFPMTPETLLRTK